MFVFDSFGFAKRKSALNNPLVVEASGITIGDKKIALDNPGHLVHLFVQATYNDLGPIMALNTLLDLSNKKFDGFTVLEKFILFERKQTPSMQAVAFENLLSKIRPVDFTTEGLNFAWEAVLESLGFKKPVMGAFVPNPSAPKLEEVQTPPTSQEAPLEVKTVELVPTVKVEVNSGSNIMDSTKAVAEEATADAVMKAVLDEMSDDTFQALKGLMIDEILVTEKLDPSKAAIVREILMESVTLDILKSENPQEAILAILYEKVVNKEDFGAMVTKAEEEAEKLPASVVEALDIIDDKPKLGRQYPARRKGKR